MICLLGNHVLAASSSNPLAVIQTDKYSGITMMKGISGKWTLPVPVYSDSDITVYIDAESIDIDITRLLTFGEMNLRNYVSDGTLNVAIVEEYKSEKMLKELIKRLKETIEKSPNRKKLNTLLYPDLLKYRSEWRHYDLRNNIVTIYRQQYLDRDGEILAESPEQKNVAKEDRIGIWPPNYTVELKSNPILIKTANNIKKIFEKEMSDPKISDSLRFYFMGTFRKNTSRPGYTTYQNDRFGYQIDYPEEFVRKRSREVDKISFYSPDKKAVLVLVGRDNNGTTLMECYDNVKGSVGDGEIKSQTIKENWFAITWRSKINNIEYISHSKMFVGNQKGAANGFMFMYPEQEKDKYANVVVNLEKSFIPGDIDRAR